MADIAPADAHTRVQIDAANAARTIVTTNTVKGTSAFNNLARLNVATGLTATLVVPDGTTNLVNLVGQQMVVDGTLESRLGSGAGAIGGNLFFVTSGGLIVGAQGRIDTGRLMVRGGALGKATTDYTPDTIAGMDGAPLIDIKGRITAPGGVDLKANSIAIGGTVLAGQRAFARLTAGPNGTDPALVSTVGLVEGAALVAVDGGIRIVGTDSVTIDKPAVLDARPGQRAASDGYAARGGIDIASSGQIKANGTLTAWDGLATSAAGDVSIVSSKSVAIDDNFDAPSIQTYALLSSASTGVDVGGAVSGGAVVIGSRSSVRAVDDLGMIGLLGTGLLDYGLRQAGGIVGLNADVLFAQADARSAVSIAQGSSVTAKGALSIDASNVAVAKGTAYTKAVTNASGVAIGIGYLNLVSAADVTVGGVLTAGGELTINATNDASSKLRVQAVSTGDALAGAVGITRDAVNATINVNGSAVLDGGSVSIKALNHQSDPNAGFENKTTTVSLEGSPGGGAVAVTSVDVHAAATNAGSIVSRGLVTIDAKTDTNKNLSWAGADTGTGFAGTANSTATATSADMSGIITDVFNKNLWDAKLTGLLGGNDADKSQNDPNGNETKTKRFGAAVATMANSQSAKAASTGSIVAVDAVQVNGTVQEDILRNNAKATTAADIKNDGQATSIAGGAAWNNTTYQTSATVGGSVKAGSLAVVARSQRDRGENYDLDLESDGSAGTSDEDVTGFAKDILAKASPTLGLEKGFFGNSAGATANTDSAKSASISGSISYEQDDIQTTAWIDQGTALTLAGPLKVAATTSIWAMNLSGALPITKLGFGVKGGSVGGIAIAYGGIDPTTIAGIGKGVTLDRGSGVAAVNADVTASTTLASFTLTPQAGQGNGMTGSGTFASNVVDGATRASISKDARLDLGTGKLTLGALSALELWAVGGSVSVNKADGTGGSDKAVSIGVAGALNDVTMVTRAAVTDTSDDEAQVRANKTGGIVAPAPAAAAAAANAGITAGDVATTATASGSINAISVAGSATSTAPRVPAPDYEATHSDQSDGKPQGYLQRSKNGLASLKGFAAAKKSRVFGDGSVIADKYTRDLMDAPGAKDKNDLSKGTPVAKSWGIAGSTSINMSKLTTRVDIGGATIRRPTGTAAGGTLLARASEGVDLLSVTGGAAIATGKSIKSSSLIAGAFGWSDTQNLTATTIGRAAILGFATVDVQAAANGSRIAAGLSLGVDTTKTSVGAVRAASVSLLTSGDGAQASVTDSSVVGTGGGGLSVLAYDGMTMGAGAGGLSWGSQDASGTAVTVVDIAAPVGGTAAATLTRTPVSKFTDLSVRGLNAARVAGVAAAGAVSSGAGLANDASAYGISINLIQIDSVAKIDLGSDGIGAIDVTGAVNVYAGDLAQGQTEPLAGAGRTSGTAGTAMLSNFAIGADTFSGDDPIHTSDLASGTQILSIAVPIAASRGKAQGAGIAWNEIDNNRTAIMVGGAAAANPATVKAGSLSVQAIDHSAIMALSAGIGGSTFGAGIMGSLSRNIIKGSATAGVTQSADAARKIGIRIGNAATVLGVVPNVSIGAARDGGIFSLSGAIAFARDGGAGGVAIGLNDITAGDGARPGLVAAADGVNFFGNPDTAITVNATGRILSVAFAGAASSAKGAVAAGATANTIAPVISATGSRLNYVDASRGDLKLTATDASSIGSIAVGLGASKASGAAGASIATNTIDARVTTSLGVIDGSAIRVRNLILDANSRGDTFAQSIGVAFGSALAGAGSVSVNKTTSETNTLLTLANGSVNATGSVGVLAKRDVTMDITAGSAAVSKSSVAGGASVVVNDIGGAATARIVGTPGKATLVASRDGRVADDRRIADVKTGNLTEVLPQFGSFAVSNADGVFESGNSTANDLRAQIKDETAAMQGVIVNAATTYATRTVALTGAASFASTAIAATAVVGNLGGTTAASISNADVTVGDGGANGGLGVDVRASTQSGVSSFAGALSGGSQIAVAAPLLLDGITSTTDARITGGTINTSGYVAVKAQANQSVTDLVVAAAVSSKVSAAVAAVSPRFQATTTALIDAPDMLKARGGNGLVATDPNFINGVAVNAQSSARAIATFGSIALSAGGAGAGVIVVVTNENNTDARYVGKLDSTTGLGSVEVDAPAVSVTAKGDIDMQAAGASIAGSAGFSLVGNGVGLVHRGRVYAGADGLRYNRDSGKIDIRALEMANINSGVGQAAVAGISGGGVALGVIAVLSQSKVDAQLVRPSVTADSVTVKADGFNQIAAIQAGLAGGAVAVGANVTYIGIGDAPTSYGLFGTTSGDSQDAKVAAAAGSDGKGGNKNLAQLSAGGSTSGAKAAAPSGLSAKDIASVTGGSTGGARNAFTSVGAPDASALNESHVGAQILADLRPGTRPSAAATPYLRANALTVDSNANLLSRSTNVQATIGGAAASGVIAITRNAAQSYATVGAVNAAGTTLMINAATGRAKAAGAGSSYDILSDSADADIYSGTVGGAALAIGVADIRLSTLATAQSAGILDFDAVTIKAVDQTTARSNVVGAALGALSALNIASATSVKDGRTRAYLSGLSVSDTLNVTAEGLGSTTAKAFAGSGGLMFAGNAAVATATDKRSVQAVIGENTRIGGTNAVNVLATMAPQVTAETFGVAVSGFLAAGASVAEATASGNVGAYIGEGTDFCPFDACGLGAVTVKASAVDPASGNNVDAKASGSAGGALAALNGASALAKNVIDVNAVLGFNLDTTTGPAARLGAAPLTVQAIRSISQSSEATGVTVGLLALGIQMATADSQGTVHAAVGNVDGAARAAADATIDAQLRDNNRANVVAGAGGAGAGVAALAKTSTLGSATAELTPGSGKTFSAGQLTVTASTDTDYRADSDSTLATLLGGSGTTSSNTVQTDAIVNVGAIAPATGGRIEAGGFRIAAVNAIGEKSSKGGSASGAGGGVVSGSAAKLDVDAVQNATVNLRDGTTLRQYGGDPTQNSYATFLDAAVITNRAHDVALNIGGVMQFPYGDITTNYRPTATVTIGNNSLIRGDQGIGIGTAINQLIVETAAAQVYGLAAAGGARTSGKSTTTGTVNVGDGATIESMMDITLAAGRSGDASRSDAIALTTQTDTFNWTALPLGTDADATTRVDQTNSVNIGAALIRSARDVTVQALGSGVKESATGEGHNPYLEIVSQTTGSGLILGRQSGGIKLTGATLIGGFLNDRSVTVNPDGSLSARDRIVGMGGQVATVTDLGRGAVQNRDPSGANYDDRLGNYMLTTGAFDVVANVTAQRAALEARVTSRGLRIPDGTDTTTSAWSQAIAADEDLAKLAGLIDTQTALSNSARELAPQAAVIGGMLDARGALLPGGGMFASGGVVALNTDTFGASGINTVIGQAGAKVDIVNQSNFAVNGTNVSRDIVIGSIFTPFKTAGAVTYGSAKGSWTGADGTPATITVINGTVNSPRSDVSVVGLVDNIGGAFRATINNGNYVQFGAVNVATFSADAPNGLFSVSRPGGAFSQGLPLSYYYGNYGLSLYDGGAQKPVTAYDLSSYIASYAAMVRYDVNGKKGGLALLRTASGKTSPVPQMFLDRTGDVSADGTRSGRTAGSSSVVWGGCIYTACEFASHDGITGDNGVVPGQVALGFTAPYYDSGNFYTPGITARDPVIVANPSGGNLPAAYTAGSINANQVLITARYVDLGGTITAGPDRDRTLTINDSVTYRGSTRYTLGTALAANPNNTIDLRVGYDRFSSGAFGNIGARFIRTGTTPNGSGGTEATGYIELDDISAGVGGWISITGKILNTNPTGGGRLVVRDGYGDIKIDNRSGYELRLGKIDAGLAPEGRITLRDTAADGSQVTTMFTNAPGQNVVRTVTTASGSVSDTLPDGVGLTTNNLITYAPTGRFYYGWDESRTITRARVAGCADIKVCRVTPWSYAAGGQAAQASGASFINLDDGADARSSIVNRALGGGTESFVQILSAKDIAWDTVQFGGGYNYSFLVPLKATATVTTAVKATYPIGIQFDQGNGAGGIQVTSKGAVTLRSALTYGGGAVGITSGSGIEGTSDAGIVGAGLNLTAGGSIGATRAMLARLTGGTVSAIANEGDINLNLASAVNTSGTAKPILINAVAASGAVSIKSDAALLGTDRDNLYNVKAGTLITLDSTGGIGGSGYDGTGLFPNPIFQRGLVIDLPNSGVLNVTAGGDVGIQTSTAALYSVDPTAVLRIGSIVTSGNVTIRAQGSVVAADATATVDTDKLARFLAAAQKLGLDPNCAACAPVTPASLALADGDLRAAAYKAFDLLAGTTDAAQRDSARQQLTQLFGTVPTDRQSIATLALVNIQRAASINDALRNQGQAAYDRYALAAPDATGDRLTAQLRQAATDALGKIDLIRALDGNAGVTLSGNAAKIQSLDFSQTSLQAGGSLYELALSTIRSTVAADGARDLVPLPAQSDVTRGLQLYLDGLRKPLNRLLPSKLPVLPANGDAATRLATVTKAITSVSLANWASDVYGAAGATLTDLFGTVPTTREGIKTGAIRITDMAQRTEGAVWKQSMLDISLPSTAFLPVADTQFQTRAPVISARGVTIVAGDSIGTFDTQKAFSFSRDGFVSPDGATGAAYLDQKNLALAYLSSAGPGDIATTVTRVDGAVAGATFTTRREVPLQLDATGTVNAVAAASLYSLQPTAQTLESPVRGNIFINNLGTLSVGSIISEKGRAEDGGSVACATGGAVASQCDSRIRLVAQNIAGVLDGAALVEQIATLNTSNGPIIIRQKLSDPAGRGLVMGGLVRMEASAGSIGNSDGSALLLDARAAEVLRAAGDINLVKRSPVSVPGTLLPRYGAATFFSFGNDLVVGDVFAGNRLTLDNPVGSFLAGQLPSTLASENRNARIVASIVSIRAAGDIGSSVAEQTRLLGQFDIQAPVVERLIAGYDYAGGRIGTGVAPTGMAGGNAYVGFRGNVQLGQPGAAAAIGARGDIGVDEVGDASANIRFASDALLGGRFSVTSLRYGNGTLSFNDGVRITTPGSQRFADMLDLSSLSILYRNDFNLTTRQSVMLGRLSAAGGSITSTNGSISLGAFDITGRGFGLTAGGDIDLTGGGLLAGGLYAKSGGNVRFAGRFKFGEIVDGDALRIDAAGQFMLTSGSRIIGQGAAELRARAATIAFDPTSAIVDSAIILTSTGEMTTGALTNTNTTQSITLRSAGTATLGTITSQAIKITNMGGTTTLKGATGGTFSLDSMGDVSAGALNVQRALLVSRQGSVNLNGASRVTGLGARSTLKVTAARAITIGRSVSAEAGVRFTAETIATAPGASITDVDGPGALQVLRADAVNVRFDTGSVAGVPFRVDVTGLTDTSARSVTLDFIGVRPIVLPRLWAYAANLNVLGTSPSLTINNLAMRDWLALRMGGGSLLLKGESLDGPATDRVVSTGALKKALLVVKPTSTVPSVQLNKITLRP